MKIMATEHNHNVHMYSTLQCEIGHIIKGFSKIFYSSSVSAVTSPRILSHATTTHAKEYPVLANAVLPTP